MQNEKAIGILGLGCYAPEKIVTNRDLEKIMDTTDAWIVERTGIRERRMADAAMATSDLAALAAQRALDDAGVKAEEIDLIIVATVTPDMFFPSVACLVQAQIKAVNAAAFDLTAACSGFVYGMVAAQQFIKTGLYKKILVIGAECFSRFVDYQDRNTSVLFCDGAGAAVIGETKSGYGIVGIDLGADGSGGDVLKVPAGGSRTPASVETVTNRLHYLQMNGKEVFKFAVKVMGDSAIKAMEDAGITVDDVDLLVPHQANTRIIESAAKRLKIPMDKVAVNVDRYGNTSSASIPLALNEFVENGRVKDGDTLLLVGFGAGLTWASCVIKWHKEAKTIA